MGEFRVIIAGGRNFKDYERLKAACDKLFAHKQNHNITIITGGAYGADFLGERYARERQMNFRVFPAKWDKYGKQAGPIRNSEMIKVAEPHALIAFYNGRSFGTEDMIKKSLSKGLLVRVVQVTYPTK